MSAVANATMAAAAAVESFSFDDFLDYQKFMVDPVSTWTTEQVTLTAIYIHTRAHTHRTVRACAPSTAISPRESPPRPSRHPTRSHLARPPRARAVESAGRIPYVLRKRAVRNTPRRPPSLRAAL